MLHCVGSERCYSVWEVRGVTVYGKRGILVCRKREVLQCMGSERCYSVWEVRGVTVYGK